MLSLVSQEISKLFMWLSELLQFEYIWDQNQKGL